MNVDGRTAAGGAAAHRHPALAAKIVQEQPFELVAEDAVDDEVDRRVDRHQQVADARHLVHQNVGLLEDVHHLGRSTA